MSFDRTGQVWEYNVDSLYIEMYLIVSDNDDGSHKMIALSTGELFQRVQLPTGLKETYWRWVM